MDPIDPSQYRLRRYPNGIWRVCWTDRRTTRSRSTGCRSQAEAAVWLARWLEDLRSTQDGERPTVERVVNHYLAERAGSVVDHRRLEHGAKALLRHLGSRIACTLRATDARRYVELRRRDGIGEGTIGQELGQLRAALRLAHEDELLDAAPPGLRSPARPEPRQRWLTRDEAARLVDACRAPHLRLFVLLALHTGARSGAIRGLTWDRVDLARRLVDFADPSRRATRKGRALLPINSTLFEALARARPLATTTHVVAWRGAPIGDPRKAFASACARAGLEAVTPHVLRHSVATWLDQAGTDLRRVAGVLGHTDSRTTERVYIHRQAEGLRNAVDQLG